MLKVLATFAATIYYPALPGFLKGYGMRFDSMMSTGGRRVRGFAGSWFWALVMCPLLLLLLLVAGACSGESAPRQEPRDQAGSKNSVAGEVTNFKGTIVAVGDSLTAGLGVDEEQAYPALLQKKLRADNYDWRVIDAGVSGETSSGALSRIEWVISALKPDIVILETGANDGLRGIDPRTLHGNLDKLVQILKERDIVVVLAGMQMLPNLGPEYVQAFGRIYPQVAQEHNTILIPFFLQGVAGKAGLNQPDRIHPTAKGYAHIVENMYPYVLEAVRKHSARPGN